MPEARTFTVAALKVLIVAMPGSSTSPPWLDVMSRVPAAIAGRDRLKAGERERTAGGGPGRVVPVGQVGSHVGQNQ